ncbi:MAG TPA: peptidase M19, partial [Gemmatimonadaceae bacterium]|nr:peptidase M19 [Gemmatimonadaceae bacterium]
MWRRVLVGLVIVLVGATGFAFVLLPGIVDRRMNTVIATTHLAITDSARVLHESLLVADMHADQLLWSRDLLARADHGHVDLARLASGNVALQVFSAVTKTPRDMNYDHNTGDTDNITLLAAVQRWPLASWTSLRARALHQADRLHAAARRSGGALVVVTDQQALRTFLERRA